MTTDSWPSTILPLWMGEGSPRSLSVVVANLHYSVQFPHRREHYADNGLTRQAALAALPGKHAIAATADDQIMCVAADGSWMAVVTVDRTDSTFFTVVADTEATADGVCAALTSAVPPESVPVADESDLYFWTENSYSPRRRRLSTPAWSDIALNYAGGVQDTVAELMAATALPESGKLILVSGPPGTGKTTFLRALVRAWSWPQAEVILDPDKSFTVLPYLQRVIGYETPGPRLLIVEDAAELIGGDAHRTGQALSRLLNVTDGLLGQGLPLVIVISTNEPLSTLHPTGTSNRQHRGSTTDSTRGHRVARPARRRSHSARRALRDAQFLTGRHDAGRTSHRDWPLPMK